MQRLYHSGKFSVEALKSKVNNSAVGIERRNQKKSVNTYTNNKKQIKGNKKPPKAFYLIHHHATKSKVLSKANTTI